MSSPIQHQSGPDRDAAAGSLTAPAYPQLRLNIDALDNNIRVMASWCRQRGVDLAPHVKTTMSAPIIARQVASGAVGVTVATVDQAGSALDWGHRHVLIANEVVDRHGLMRLRSWLEARFRTGNPLLRRFGCRRRRGGPGFRWSCRQP